MPDSDRRTPVTIEALLKLKRAERPAPAFWDTFERELRQKQLTALIEKRAWWQVWPQLVSRRVYQSAGVAAVVAFTLVTVKYTGSNTAKVPDTVGQSIVVVSPKALVNATPLVPVAMVANSTLVNLNESVGLSVDDRVAISAHGQTAMPISSVAHSGRDARDALTPSARSIAANFAQLEQAEPELVNAMMGNRLSVSARPATESVANVELASLANGSSRRSRFLAQYGEQQKSSVVAAHQVVREQLVRRLSDLDYADRFTRIGLKGDQFSLKF